MFQVIGNTYGIQKDFLEKVAQAAFSFLDTKNIEVELKFVSEAEISRLNGVYRHKSCATDVLSFILDEKPLLGQVFICYTFTKKQAKRLDKSLESEVALLLVHGILHIAGYDHQEHADTGKMEAAENEILGGLGLCR